MKPYSEIKFIHMKIDFWPLKQKSQDFWILGKNNAKVNVDITLLVI